VFPAQFFLPFKELRPQGRPFGPIRARFSQVPGGSMPGHRSAPLARPARCRRRRALVASYAAVSKGAQLKDIGRIDVHMGRFIALSPLCLIATADAAGKQDVHPARRSAGRLQGAGRAHDHARRPAGQQPLDTLKTFWRIPRSR